MIVLFQLINYFKILELKNSTYSVNELKTWFYVMNNIDEVIDFVNYLEHSFGIVLTPLQTEQLSRVVLNGLWESVFNTKDLCIKDITDKDINSDDDELGILLEFNNHVNRNNKEVA